MKSGYYRLGILLRVIAIAVTTILGVLLYQYNESVLGASFFVLFVLIEVAEFFRFADRINRQLTLFLESIRFSDFTVNFSRDDKMGRSFVYLHEAFNAVLEAFRKTREEKEEHLNYLNTVVQQVNTGLLSFDAEGYIGLINPSAKRFLGVSRINKIGEIEGAKPLLYQKLLHMKPGEKAMHGVDSDTNLALQSLEIVLRGRKFKLFVMQNIHAELQSKEVEAWQNLTRVLRHEIMNSITPIASLAGTLNEILKDDIEKKSGQQCTVSEETVEDLVEGLRTIENRSNGLVQFVDSYRDYTSIPKPSFAVVEIDALYDHILQLLQPEFEGMGIAFEVQVLHKDLRIKADRELLEMVLINLLKNAREALVSTPAPQIILRAGTDGESRIFLEVEDNGPGIIPEALDQIFIPFYTTKKKGSGIGLALSRQIMQLHNGSLTVRSVPGVHTIFTLRF